ncbi:diaminopimelate epimerase [Roseateles depolymerans]|uniref:Diaminopimelate epimerase n=1 Tax=Roseateles depolymerans TaxID=76731 RepID=A0A0U3MCM2_9BURK|nr:diaminopimelate epimerase [Roseateles depolymerans]ALV05164.1 diaminopimelate epimerase [Roseateles depolymerans]REG14820.1 diaminopimelate epimerase [Roseateles depolymerans]
MKLRFTKMHGAGNDFVVLDATQHPMQLTHEQLRHVADRRFGVGCDQILVIESSRTPGVDFGYRIFNADGSEVEHCGNGSRCFVRYVVDKGLTDKRTVRVQTVNKILELRLREDGRVTVDMGAPIFDLPQVPFQPEGLTPRALNGFDLWPLALGDGMACEVAVLSMGNPHAVQRVEDVDHAPVGLIGPQVEGHERFPRRVNAGFLQIVSRSEVKLRVFERGSGETLACGTGACAAVVAGIRLGWLDEAVEVHTHGGDLRIEWAGLTQGLEASVFMTGPAQTVFEGEIEL